MSAEKKGETQFELDLVPAKVVKPKIGIVDADSIMFNLGWWYAKSDLLPPDADFSAASIAPNFVHEAVDENLSRLRKEMEVDELHLHFTAGPKNQRLFEEFMGRPMRAQFRSTLGNTYKAARKEAMLPCGYHYTLRALLQLPNSYIHDEWEADEAVILHKKLNPDHVLSSNDKDVYKQHHGKAYAYDKRHAWFDIDKDYANYFAYLQAITGDIVDGFIGVKGIGPKKAEAFVSPSNTPAENWEGVLEAFHSKGFDDREALMNMRFANMHQLRLDDSGKPYVDIWKPDSFHLQPSWK